MFKYIKLKYFIMSFHILPVGRLGNMMFSFYIFAILKDKYPNHKIYIYDNYIKHYYKKEYDKLLETFPVIKDFIIKSDGDGDFLRQNPKQNGMNHYTSNQLNNFQTL